MAGLPLWLLHRLGALVGLATFVLSAGYRGKFNRAWRQSGIEGSRRKAIEHAGKMALESLWIWVRPFEEVIAKVSCDDIQVLNNAEAKGSGIIFLTPHLGTFEVTARFYAARAPITVLFKPSKSATLNRLLDVSRALPQLLTAPADSSGVRKLLKALKHHQAIGLLPDQVPGDGQGQWAPFFGAPAYTMNLPEKLHALSGASLVLAVGERLSGGQGWQLHLEEFTATPTPENVNAAMERLIRKLPDQYLWGYNRYKKPALVSGVETR